MKGSVGVVVRRSAMMLLGLILAACDQTLDQPILEVEAVGQVNGVLFNDLNGSGRADGGDRGVEGWQVRLEQPGGGVLAMALTDTAGRFEFSEVPVGRVALEADPSLLGDTLEFFGVAFDTVTVAAGGVASLQPGVTYPHLEVSEAREADLGQTVFTVGVALNSLNQNVSMLHVQDVDGGGAVIRVRDLVGVLVNVGDSVRVRGRTSRTAGQPSLSTGAVFRLGLSSATLEPTETSTGSAATAGGGDLDGALVQVRDAAILEVVDLDDQGIRVVVDDGSGELEILLRAFLNENVDDLDPDSVIVTRARGLMVPREEAGETVWQLQPRTRSDYRLDDIFPLSAVSDVAASRHGVVSPRHHDGPYQGRHGKVKAVVPGVFTRGPSGVPDLQ